MKELWVFGHHHHARFAGFVAANGKHRQSEDMIAWWPEMGPDRLRGYQFQKVVITESYHRNAIDQPRELSEIRARCRPGEPVWVEL